MAARLRISSLIQRWSKVSCKGIVATCLMALCRTAAACYNPLPLMTKSSSSNVARLSGLQQSVFISGLQRSESAAFLLQHSRAAVFFIPVAYCASPCRLSSNLPTLRAFALAATGTPLGALTRWEADVDISDCELIHSRRMEAVTVALESFLRGKKGLEPNDAAFISRHCPVYASKVVARLRWATENEADGWFKKAEVNELEPFLESVGMNPGEMDEVLPLVSVPLAGEEGLLRSIEVLESIGISRRKMWDVFGSNRKLLIMTAADLRVTVDFLEGLGVKRKDMLRLIQDSCFLTDNLGILQNLEKLGVQKHVIAEILKTDPHSSINMPIGSLRERVAFLLESGLSKSEVSESLKLFPQLLHMRLENLKRKIQFFDSIGLERERIAKIIARWPLIFRQSVEQKLRPKIEMLQSLGVGRDGIAKILARYPELGAVSLESNLKQKVAFFEANGLTGRRLVKLMTSHPRALTLSVNDLNKKLQFLVQKGFSLGSVEMLRALGVCITMSVEAMEARYLNLESLGFSPQEGREAVKQQPAILTLSENCIRDKAHYLVHTMNRSIEEIVKCPNYLLYSLELRIKPRHRVLTLLKTEGVLREEAYSLNTIMIISEKRFMERFVISLGAQYPHVAAAYYQRGLSLTKVGATCG